MDVNDLRAAVTVVSFVCFAGIIAWAYARRNRARFEEDALLPFQAEQAPPAPRAGSRT